MGPASCSGHCCLDARSQHPCRVSRSPSPFGGHKRRAGHPSRRFPASSHHNSPTIYRRRRNCCRAQSRATDFRQPHKRNRNQGNAHAKHRHHHRPRARLIARIGENRRRLSHAESEEHHDEAGPRYRAAGKMRQAADRACLPARLVNPVPETIHAMPDEQRPDAAGKERAPMPGSPRLTGSTSRLAAPFAACFDVAASAGSQRY